MDMFAKQEPGSQKVILGQLMAHAIEGVEAKAAKASIKYLLKRLQSKEELCSLMTAVTTKGGQPTGCVMMKRTVDGRIHIYRGESIPASHILAAVVLAPSHQQELDKQPMQIRLLHDGVSCMRKPVTLRAAGR